MQYIPVNYSGETMSTMIELLNDLDSDEKKRSWSRQALKELFRDEKSKEERKKEKDAWESKTKVVSPIVIAHIQSELANLMNDSMITLNGGAALNIRVIANLQKRGESKEGIREMTRAIHDLDFISAKASLEVDKLDTDPSVTGLKKVKRLVVMHYGGVLVHVKNANRFTNYKLPTKFIVEEASDVNIEVMSKTVSMHIVAPEDLIMGKLNASRFEDCIKERKRGVLGTNPPKHIHDALTYIYTENKRISDFFEARREGFEKRIKVSTKIESVGALLEDLITMSKRLIGWEYGISERMKGLIAADDSLPIELREAVEAKRDEKAKL
jgi:hypothetical protein